jgi:hypothetical protein
VQLQTFDLLEWMSSDDGLETLSDGMNRYHVQPLLTDEMEAGLSLADARSVKAGLLGANPDGLFKVPD